MTQADVRGAKVRGHCPKCGPEIWARELAKHVDLEQEDEGHYYFETTNRMLQCLGCERVYFQRREASSFDDERGGPDVKHWPVPRFRKEPAWFADFFTAAALDDDLTRILREVYAALDNDAWTLAAIGIRTAFDRASELLGIDPDLPFAAKLDALLKGQHVSKSQRAMLEQLTDAGSAAAHRGWRPSKDNLNTLMDIIEPFLHHAFILPKEAERLGKAVPPRKRTP